MYDIVRHCRSLKLKWISRLVSGDEEFWQVHVASCFAIPLSLFFQANIKGIHLNRVLVDDRKLPSIWIEIFQLWCHFNFLSAKDCPRDTVLAYNSLLKTKFVFDHDIMSYYTSRGVITVYDFLSLVPRWDIVLRRRYKFINIRQAIRKAWPLHPNGTGERFFDVSLPITVRAITKELSKKSVFRPIKVWDKWQRILQVNGLEFLWASICKIAKHFVQVKYRSYYWKFLNFALPTNNIVML